VGRLLRVEVLRVVASVANRIVSPSVLRRVYLRGGAGPFQRILTQDTSLRLLWRRFNGHLDLDLVVQDLKARQVLVEALLGRFLLLVSLRRFGSAPALGEASKHLLI